MESLFQPDSLLRCLLVTQGSILRDATSAHPLFTSFLILCLLAINDEAQQGGQSGFTILAALLSRFCLQIFTGDREQTRTGTGGIFSKKNCSSDYHTKTSASLASPIRFSRMNLPPVSVPLFPIVPTIKTSALIFRHPLCNLQLH